MAHAYGRHQSRLILAHARIAHAVRASLPLVALLVAVMAINFLTLMRTPPPLLDEVWFTNRAWALLQTGLAFGTLDSGVFDHYDGYWTYFPWLPTWFQALAIQVFGLSLFSVRMASLAAGLVLLVAVYTVAHHFGGQRLGLLAVLMVALSRAFFYSAHLARPESMVAAVGFIAIALYVTDRTTLFSCKSILAGLAVGIAFEIHPFGMIYGPVIGVMYLLDYGWAAVRTKSFWGFIGGAGAGLLFYAAMHVIPYPQTYFAINLLVALASGAVRTPPIFVLDPAVWFQAIVDMTQQFLLLWNLRIPLILMTVLLLLKPRLVDERRLLRLFIILVLAYLLLIRNKNPWYAILVAPVGDIMAAYVLDRLLKARLSSVSIPSMAAIPFFDRVLSTILSRIRAHQQPMMRMLCASLIVIITIPSLTRALNNPMDDYQLTLDRVREVVQPGSSIIGPATYWLGVTNERYISWEQMVYYRRYMPGSSIEQTFQAFNVDYFIIDHYIEQFISDTPRTSVNAQQLLISKTDLQQFLERRAQLIAVVTTATYGDVRIYRVGTAGALHSGAHGRSSIRPSATSGRR